MISVTQNDVVTVKSDTNYMVTLNVIISITLNDVVTVKSDNINNTE